MHFRDLYVYVNVPARYYRVCIFAISPLTMFPAENDGFNFFFYLSEAISTPIMLLLLLCDYPINIVLVQLSPRDKMVNSLCTTIITCGK